MGSLAPTLLRDARTRAGLTQAELGAKARVAQSVVSAYESGKRQPSLETLTKLVNATGLRLQVALVESAPQSRLQSLLAQHRVELTRALERLGATNIRAFGSAARGDDAPDSDIDLLVDIDDSVGLFAIAQMRGAAEELLGVPVDIVPSNSLKPDVSGTVLTEAVPL